MKAAHLSISTLGFFILLTRNSYLQLSLSCSIFHFLKLMLFGVLQLIMFLFSASLLFGTPFSHWKLWHLPEDYAVPNAFWTPCGNLTSMYLKWIQLTKFSILWRSHYIGNISHFPLYIYSFGSTRRILNYLQIISSFLLVHLVNNAQDSYFSRPNL